MPKPSLPPALADLVEKAQELRTSLQRLRYALEPLAQRRAQELGNSLPVESATTRAQLVAFQGALRAARLSLPCSAVVTLGNALCAIDRREESGGSAVYVYGDDAGRWVHTTNDDYLREAAHRADKCLFNEFHDALRQAAATSPRSSSRAALPIWKRLTVETSNELVTLDGTAYRVTETQAKFLRVLWTRSQAKDRQDVKARDLAAVATRPERVWAGLPKALQAIVSKPGRGRIIGYRLMAAERR